MVGRASGEIPPFEQGVYLVHLIRARQLLREGRLEEAREQLEHAELARPGDEDALNLVSILEFKRGNFTGAAVAARTLVASNPASAILHANLGLILFRAGLAGEAEEELRRALELKPDHVRSHLTLGLLYRDQGKLEAALAHLRGAGARRLVDEIEEALLLAQRLAAASSEPSPAEADRATEEEEDALRPQLKLAPPPDSPAETSAEESAPGPAADVAPWQTAEEPAPFETSAAGAEDEPEAEPTPLPEGSPAVTPTGAPPPRSPEPRPLFVLRTDGALEIASQGVVYVRKGSVAWYSGKLRFSAEPSFRGTRLESILRADGLGYLFVHDPGRFSFRRDLAGESLFLEGSRLLALDHGLSFGLEPIHAFRMNRRVDVLKIHGNGSVILSVAGPLLAHEVSGEFPLNVSSRDLVAWSGNLVPSVLEDRFLEQVMQPDNAGAPKIRFEGEGTVLTEPPRPRRRASDLGRTGSDRRRP